MTVVNQTTFVSGRVRLARLRARPRGHPHDRDARPCCAGRSRRADARVDPGRGAPGPRDPATRRGRVAIGRRPRVPPPPPPPRFDAKVAVIRSNNAARRSPPGGRASVPQNDVATGDAGAPGRRPSRGASRSCPSNDNSRVARPEPVAPVRGRPTAATPANAPSPRQAAPQQQPPAAQSQERVVTRPQERPQQQAPPERVTPAPFAARPTPAGRPPERLHPTPRPEPEIARHRRYAIRPDGLRPRLRLRASGRLRSTCVRHPRSGSIRRRGPSRSAKLPRQLPSDRTPIASKRRLPPGRSPQSTSLRRKSRHARAAAGAADPETQAPTKKPEKSD